MSHFMVRWLKLSLVVIVGCGFLAMMIYALINREEIRSSQIEPPLITPPAEPLKRRPDQPGGMQIPNRDKLVFDLLDSGSTALGSTGVELAPEVSPTQVAGMKVANVSDSVAAIQAVGMNVVTSTAAAHTVSEVKTVAPKAVIQSVEEPKVEAKKVEVKAAEKVEEPKKTTGGKWGVQLAAVNSQADGNAMTAKVAKDFPVLGSLTPRVSAVPGAKKFRVQFVGLKDREAAAATCAKLAGKQACFPVSVQ